MTSPRDVLGSRQGRILYAELPEEYRYRDSGIAEEFGDLEAYLHGFGHLLDLMRGTIEQAHADSFAEPLEDGRAIQPWMLPYLAELVGAELISPAAEERVAELGATVGWSKSKGTPANIDDVADVMAGAETVSREGWHHVLTCPRPALPPFSVPGGAQTHQGCPDLARMDRPVTQDAGTYPAEPLRFGADTLTTAPLAPGGAPAFPQSYGDRIPRCPDLRSPERGRWAGPHPRRTLIHLRPPGGLFAPGAEITLTDPTLLGLESGLAVNPTRIWDRLGRTDPVPARLRVRLDGDLALPAGAEIRMEDIVFVGRVADGSGTRLPRIAIPASTQLHLARCALPPIRMDGGGLRLTAHDSLIESVFAPDAGAELVYVTVMGGLTLARLNASDCLLNTLSSDILCTGGESCVRYSRLAVEAPNRAAARKCFDGLGARNTRTAPVFAPRYRRLQDAAPCALALPRYGDPGYGVLDLTCPAAIARGAEDEGEMGAHHHLHLTARADALTRKLAAYLPLGQEAHILYDPLLALRPPIGPKRTAEPT